MNLEEFKLEEKKWREDIFRKRKNRSAKLDNRRTEYSDKKIVYFINVEGTDITKIGHTRDKESLKKRFMLIKAYNHMPIKLTGYIECNNGIKIEEEIHRLLKEYRISGEWFRTDMKLLSAYSIIYV